MSDDRGENGSSPRRKRDDIRKRPMPTEDKVLLGILGVVVPLIVVGALFALRWVLVSLVGLTAGIDAGVGLRDAFVASIVISVVMMIVFAIVAGDGALGELTIMIIGFFIMVVFFTLSIALIL